MIDLIDLLEKLCSETGVAGNEFSASRAAAEFLREFAPDAKVDPFGTVTGSITVGDALPTLLLDAHIDEIGLTVTFIDDDGFVKVGKSGGVDTRVLPAQTVTLWGKEPIKGVICSVPPHLADDDCKAIKIDKAAIDTGYSKEELEKLLSAGDSVTLDGGFERLPNGRVCGKSLDDRAGVACILYALHLAQGKRLKYNIVVNFSSQEELGCRGAKIGSYNAEADFAIAVDVSYGAMPGCDETKTGKLGGGVMIGIAPSLDREMFGEMKEAAEKHKIPYQIEVMPGKTGTTADEISISRSGVRCALLSIPERNMHMPVELLEIEDIKSTARLIAMYLTEE